MINEVVRSYEIDMRTTVLILGLIAATMLFLGGTCGYVFGSVGVSFEESFDTELDDDDGSSTTEEVQGAGAFAVIVAILLYAGAGIARVAYRTSFALLAVCLGLSVIVVMIDTTSLFAAFYYLSIVLTVICLILMWVSRRRARQPSS